MLLVIGCNERPFPQESEEASGALTAAQMRADLAQYRDAVLQGWSYLKHKEDQQAVDVVSTFQSLSAQITESTTHQQFYLILRTFAASLLDGHSQVFCPELEEPFLYSWPIGTALVREGVVVDSLAYLKDNPGVDIGDLIVEVNGIPISTYLNARMSFTSASTEHAQKVAAVEQIFRHDSPSVELTLTKTSGQSVTVSLTCISGQISFRRQEPFCEFKDLESGIRYIRIPEFVFNRESYFQANSDVERNSLLAEARKKIDAAFAATNEMKGVILDLRGNSGGLELLSSYVAEQLVPGDFKYFEIERRDSAFVRSLQEFKGFPEDAFGRRFEEHPKKWTAFTHYDGPSFRGRLIVLIDEMCFSTTDNLCAFLRDVRANTKFVGRPTNGGTGQPTVAATLTHSHARVQFCVSRVYSPNGRLIEGVGTTPDVVVELIRDDVVTQNDAIIDRAIIEMNNWR